MYFVLGEQNCYKSKEMQFNLLQDENRTYSDIVDVGGPECTKLSMVVKTRNWFEYALRFNTTWIVKTDDDVIWNPTRLRNEMSSIPPRLAYHGIMRWRMYSPNASSACGRFLHLSPPKSHPGFGHCPLGPFLYADGVFETLSSDLVKETLLTSMAKSRMAAAMKNYQEDTTIGSIIYEEASQRKLAVNYFALRPWIHNRFWVDFRDARTIPDESVSHVHRIYNSRLADVARRKLTSHVPYAFKCHSCERWNFPPQTHSNVACPLTNKATAYAKKYTNNVSSHEHQLCEYIT